MAWIAQKGHLGDHTARKKKRECDLRYQVGSMKESRGQSDNTITYEKYKQLMTEEKRGGESGKQMNSSLQWEFSTRNDA